MSAFDPELFLQTQTEDASSTEFTPFPMGEWPAMVKDVKARVIEGKDGGPSRPVLDVTYFSDHAEVKEALGRDDGGQVRQSIWLDMTDAGTLDMGKGKNVSLGRLREAVGQNRPGQPWNPLMLIGSPVIITVTHTPSKTGDGSVFANVASVAAA